jgi:hypothetical protein
VIHYDFFKEKRREGISDKGDPVVEGQWGKSIMEGAMVVKLPWGRQPG